MDPHFGAQIEEHRPHLHRTALRLCGGDVPLAEDMVQETYCKAIRHARRFAPGTNLRAWLTRILHNTVMSAHRRRRTAREGPFPAGFEPALPRPEEPARLEIGDELTRALGSLPEPFRRVFLLAALEDFSYQGIADRLGIPVGTVMSRLWRSRRILQRSLAGAIN